MMVELGMPRNDFISNRIKVGWLEVDIVTLSLRILYAHGLPSLFALPLPSGTWAS